jgi:NAD(P)-dependent dehydrogenase (short-subunit alcohol dehydrogenase family)
MRRRLVDAVRPDQGGGMTTILITGANKGLGRESARRLIELGHTVYLGARDAERGRRVAEELGGLPLLIDVTDDRSVDEATAWVRDQSGGLDVLINNAGIPGGFKAPGETTALDLRTVYDTNVFGVVRVTHAFLPVLEKSPAPVVVNVSSGMGSLAVTTDPNRLESSLHGLAYPSSKSALNMITSQYAKAYPAFRINCVDPGYTATDLNGHRGTQTVEQGAEIIVRMALVTPDGPTGTFSAANGPVPW